MTNGWHWCSSRALTVIVRVQANRVVESPPITRKFIGQPFVNLLRWMNRQGGLTVQTIHITTGDS